jgi:hypothetical protein
MDRTDYFETPVLAKGEKTPWSPLAKLMLAFIIGTAILSPAILGIYWHILLPK